MKKVAIVGVRRAVLVDAPDPTPVEDWAVVKIHAAPMCAEYKNFIAGHKTDNLGHEAAGEVVAVGAPGPVKVGDRVVVMPLCSCGVCPLCRAGDYIYCQNSERARRISGSASGGCTMAQYILKPPHLLLPLPDGVSYELGSLACCGLGPSFGAFQEMRLSAFDTVLITGAGPVGLGAIINARFRGARVIAVESVPYRVAMAREVGAEHVLSPTDDRLLSRILELTDGRGVDCALDCAGNVQAERLCIDATRRRGRVAFIGECQDELHIKVSPDLIRKGLTVIGSWHYNLGDYSALLKVIRQSPVVGKLITHTMPMSRIQEAFELSASHQCGKIVLKPWE
jgi:L-iditol 2-dehydrogenase